MPTTPTFDYEQPYWQQNITTIAGLDEAGMGALAGPVVAAAVVFPPVKGGAGGSGRETPPIRDSKTLSARQRETAAAWIKENTTWATGAASVEEITALNIRRAAHLAMQRAIDQLAPTADLLLIDGNPAQPHPTIPAINIINGDALSLSIATASILAKVHRDSIMIDLAQQHPAYGFEQHKGYGSAAHLQALQQHGPSPHHRPTYAPVAALTKQPK